MGERVKMVESPVFVSSRDSGEMKKYQDIEKTSRDRVRLSERPVTSIGTAVVACPGAVPGRPGPGPDVGSGCVSSLDQSLIENASCYVRRRVLGHPPTPTISMALRFPG